MHENSAVQELVSRLDRLDQRIVSSSRSVTDRLSAVESRVRAQLEELERQASHRAAALGTRMNSTTVGFKQTRAHLDEMEARLYERMEAIESRVQNRIDALESRVDAIGRHFADM